MNTSTLNKLIPLLAIAFFQLQVPPMLTSGQQGSLFLGGAQSQERVAIPELPEDVSKEAALQWLKTTLVEESQSSSWRRIDNHNASYSTHRITKVEFDDCSFSWTRRESSGRDSYYGDSWEDIDEYQFKMSLKEVDPNSIEVLTDSNGTLSTVGFRMLSEKRIMTHKTVINDHKYGTTGEVTNELRKRESFSFPKAVTADSIAKAFTHVVKLCKGGK
jgi:hypothetical protein